MGEERRKLIHWVTFIVSMVVIVSIMLFNCYTKLKREGAEYYEDEMAAIATDHAEKIAMELEKLKIAGETAAQMLSIKEKPGKTEIKNAMSAILDNTEAYRIIYHKGVGSGIGWNGSELKEYDLRECTYYRTIYKASSVKYLYVKDDGISGEEAILLIVPIGDSIDRNLLIFYPMGKIENLLRINSEFDSNSFAALITATGDIISNGNYDSKFFTYTNFWSSVPRDYRNEITKAKVQVINRISGCLQVTSLDGSEEKTLVYAPVNINEWVVMIGVDQDLVNKRETNYWKKSWGMLWQLTAVLFFFFTVFFIFNLISKMKTQENDKLLREKADTDQLTGLTNKLATEHQIKEYMAQNPDALGMMFVVDIDNFKKINDTLGHAFGDDVIRSFGHSIGSVFRVSDIIGRTGGDEFTIFLKFLKNDENTLREAQKLVNFFKDFTVGEYVKYSPTASIGAAVFPTNGKDFDSLYKAADTALYMAKRRGKNQLAFYDDRDKVDKEEI